MRSASREGLPIASIAACGSAPAMRSRASRQSAYSEARVPAWSTTSSQARSRSSSARCAAYHTGGKNHQTAQEIVATSWAAASRRRTWASSCSATASSSRAAHSSASAGSSSTGRKRPATAGMLTREESTAGTRERTPSRARARSTADAIAPLAGAAWRVIRRTAMRASRYRPTITAAPVAQRTMKSDAQGNGAVRCTGVTDSENAAGRRLVWTA